MTFCSKCVRAAWPIVITVSLTACGGGGGATTSVVSATAPTSTATSTPTFTSAAVIGAPAIAAAPNAALFPLASDGGPTLQSRAKTIFPLLESVVSISTGKVAADTATINAGATLTFDSSNSSYVIDIKNSALNISNIVLTATPSGIFQADVAGGKTVFLGIADPNTSNLGWTSYGYWDVAMADGARTTSNFVTGYATPAASVPTQGTATFIGIVNGEGVIPLAGQTNNGVGFVSVSGKASLLTDFANRTINGNLTQMVTTGFEGNKDPWNSVSVSGTLSGNTFAGTSAVTSTPGTVGSLSTSATGTLAGTFFGPKAQELGAVWTLSDGTAAAFGTIAAKAGP